MPEQSIIELTRTKIFPDPMKPARFIRGVLYGKKSTGVPTQMQVWFYHNETDNEPYWVTTYGLHGFDETFVAYHRRSLFRGLRNNINRKYQNQ